MPMKKDKKIRTRHATAQAEVCCTTIWGKGETGNKREEKTQVRDPDRKSGEHLRLRIMDLLQGRDHCPYATCMRLFDAVSRHTVVTKANTIYGGFSQKSIQNVCKGAYGDNCLYLWYLGQKFDLFLPLRFMYMNLKRSMGKIFLIST